MNYCVCDCDIVKMMSMALFTSSNWSRFDVIFALIQCEQVFSCFVALLRFAHKVWRYNQSYCHTCINVWFVVNVLVYEVNVRTGFHNIWTGKYKTRCKTSHYYLYHDNSHLRSFRERKSDKFNVFRKYRKIPFTSKNDLYSCKTVK